MFKNINRCLLLLGLFFCAFLSGHDVHAAENPSYQMQISPTKAAIESLIPGEDYKGSFNVKNTGTESLDIEVFASPYSVESETYVANFTQETIYTELSKWMTVTPEAGTIEPGEEMKITYVINVPSGAHGGTQNAAIMVRATNIGESSEGSSVQTLPQIGYIMYSNVDGVVTKTGKVLENNVPGFLFNPPIIGTSLVENTGNVYTRASYKLQVFPLFSDEEVYTNEENPDENIVFPETKRYNEIKWEGSPSLGIFRVKQTVKIFDSETVTEKLVVLCPIWFLFICLVVLFIIIFSIVNHLRNRGKEA